MSKPFIITCSTSEKSMTPFSPKTLASSLQPKEREKKRKKTNFVKIKLISQGHKEERKGFQSKRPITRERQRESSQQSRVSDGSIEMSM